MQSYYVSSYVWVYFLLFWSLTFVANIFLDSEKGEGQDGKAHRLRAFYPKWISSLYLSPTSGTSVYTSQSQARLLQLRAGWIINGGSKVRIQTCFHIQFQLCFRSYLFLVTLFSIYLIIYKVYSFGIFGIIYKVYSLCDYITRRPLESAILI